MAFYFTTDTLGRKWVFLTAQVVILIGVCLSIFPSIIELVFIGQILIGAGTYTCFRFGYMFINETVS